MISLLSRIIPYISGLYTLPWILVGFVFTNLLASIGKPERIDYVMKKIGLIILYCFVPVLIFRIFLDTPIGKEELNFFSIACVSICLMYSIALLFAKMQIKRQKMNPSSSAIYLKTMLTNQGRSSAFVGGAMLAIPGWGVDAAIYMAVVGLMLFAVVPYLLSWMAGKAHGMEREKVHLPWFLRFYPWFFITFVIAAVILQKTTHISTRDMGDWGTVLRFYAAITIPAALYYVGSGMHIKDMRLGELKKLLGIEKDSETEHWQWVRQILFLTTVLTPLVFTAIFGTMLLFKLIPSTWFAVIIINSVLPITGTNMFLIPYGLDKRATAHSVTWSTIICVPIVVLLIEIFSLLAY